MTQTIQVFYPEPATREFDLADPAQAKAARELFEALDTPYRMMVGYPDPSNLTKGDQLTEHPAHLPLVQALGPMVGG